MRHRCIIVDDEPISMSILSKYIASVPILELVGTCNNSLQALEMIHENKIDLIYLDIDMPGTDLVKALPRPPAMIFTSAHKEFAMDAFELNAVDYLLKPVSFERFLKAVNKLHQNYSGGYDNTPFGQDYIYFRSNKKMVKVILENILYIESFKDYVLIHRIDEPEVKTKHAFNTLEAILPRQRFLRVHRSFIISKPRVTAYSRDFVEIGKLEIPIGRKYKDITASLATDNRTFL